MSSPATTTTTSVTDVRDLFMANEKLRATQGKTRVASISKFKELPTALTFSAFVTECVPLTGAKGTYYRVTFTPVFLARLQPRDVDIVDDAAPARLPLFAFATADRRAIALHVYDDVISKGRQGVKGERIRRRCPEPLLLAERCLYTISLFRTGESGVPQPNTLVTIYNAVATMYNGRVSINEVQAIDSGAFDGDENALPVDARLRVAFAAPQQEVPALLPLLPLGNEARESIPLPGVHILVNRDRCSSEIDAGGDTVWHLPAVIPTPPIAVAPSGVVTDVTFIGRPVGYMHAGNAPETDRTEVKFSLRVRQLVDNATVHQYLFKEFVLYGEQCVGLGVRYPRVVQALLSNHAIPFQLFFQPLLNDSIADSANTDPSAKLRAGFEDGVFKGKAHSFHWELVAYLAARGERIDRGVAEQRYNGPFVQPYKQEDFDAVCAPRKVQSKTTGKSYDIPELKNPMAELLPLHASGVIALDEYKGMLPDATEFAFFALPLFPLSEPRPAGRTMEDSSKWVLAQRSGTATSANPHGPWLQPPLDPALEKRRIPKFLFYAVQHKALEAAAAAAATTVVDTAVVGSLEEAAAASLPRNLEALRMQCVKQAEEVLERRGFKRPLEDDMMDAAAAAPSPPGADEAGDDA